MTISKPKIKFERIYSNGRYSWPSPLESEEQYRKFFGLDIDGMPPFDRWQELKKLEFVVAWLDDSEEALHYRPDGGITTKLNWAVDRIRKLKQRQRGVK